jgi:uncharacterized protein (DUF983 family)
MRTDTSAKTGQERCPACGHHNFRGHYQLCFACENTGVEAPQLFEEHADGHHEAV